MLTIAHKQINNYADVFPYANGSQPHSTIFKVTRNVTASHSLQVLRLMSHSINSMVHVYNKIPFPHLHSL